MREPLMEFEIHLNWGIDKKTKQGYSKFGKFGKLKKAVSQCQRYQVQPLPKSLVPIT